MVARPLADQAFLESRDEPPGPQFQLIVLGGAAGEGRAVDLADEIDADPIASGGAAVHLFPGAALLTQLCDHLVDVRLGDLAGGRGQLQVGDRPHGHLGVDLEGGRIGEALARLDAQGIDDRRPGRPQLLLNHGIGEAAANYLADHFVANPRRKALFHQSHRRLARPKAIDTRRARDRLEAAPDLLADLLFGYLDGEAALQGAGAAD